MSLWTRVILLILLAWSVVATGFAVFYYTKCLGLEELFATAFMKVSICLNYGNGTEVWHNGTLISAGASVLDLTMAVARVDTTTYAGHKGVGVNAINDVVEKPDQRLYWLWFYWDPEAEQWVLGPAMPSEYELKSGDIICWYYEVVTTWPPTPPA